MDIEIIKLLFSVGFVLLGSAVFYISGMISGTSIYREMDLVESAFLSTAVGIFVFLLTPVGFIILLLPGNGNQVVNLFLDILGPFVLLSFFSFAVGLGIIFGYLIMLGPRINILSWFRELSQIPFWIRSYSIAWDNTLSTVKNGGEITIKTKNEKDITGYLKEYSIRKETREIVIDSDGIRIIPGSEINSIIIPGKSIKKHDESLNHIGQAFYCVMITVGIILLLISAYGTFAFVDSYSIDEFKADEVSENRVIQYDEVGLRDLKAKGLEILVYYEYLLIFIFFSILIVAAYLAKKDFESVEAYYAFCSDFIFLPIVSFIAILLMFFGINILDISLICLVLLLVYIFKIRRKRIKNDISRIVNNIISDEDIRNLALEEMSKKQNKKNEPIRIINIDYYIYNKLNLLRRKMYLNLCLDEKDKSRIEDLMDSIQDNEDDKLSKNIGEKFVKILGNAKRHKKYQYLKNEDINILLFLNYYLKNKLKEEITYSTCDDVLSDMIDFCKEDPLNEKDQCEIKSSKDELNGIIERLNALNRNNCNLNKLRTDYLSIYMVINRICLSLTKRGELNNDEIDLIWNRSCGKIYENTKILSDIKNKKLSCSKTEFVNYLCDFKEALKFYIDRMGAGRWR
jgi:hypothetical protein